MEAKIDKIARAYTEPQKPQCHKIGYKKILKAFTKERK